LLSTLSRSIVGYYVALKISAGAVSAWLPNEPRSDPSPIVRAARQTHVGGFDIREVVENAGRLHVVTLPVGLEERAVSQQLHRVSLN
jgi:hypothetical protein